MDRPDSPLHLEYAKLAWIADSLIDILVVASQMGQKSIHDGLLVEPFIGTKVLLLLLPVKPP
jgi:hypothetical protein